MNDDAPRTVMQQLTQRQPVAVPDVPLTASRAVKLAVTRAAQTRVALTLSVSSIGEEVLDLDEVLAALTDDLLIMGLGEGSDTRGIVVCDAALCGVAVEVQTTGKIAGRSADPRPITRADAALIQPFLSGLLEELAETTQRTALEGWTEGVSLLSRLAGPRATGFVLGDHPYRVVRVSIGWAGEDGKSEVLLALPPHKAAPLARPKVAVPKGDWAKEFPQAVLAAPACLNAVLHRFELPLSVATQLQVGQVLPLHGCNVGTVRLLAPDGSLVAKARLGQVAGQIAVRVEDGPKLDLRELPPQRVATQNGDEKRLVESR